MSAHRLRGNRVIGRYARSGERPRHVDIPLVGVVVATLLAAWEAHALEYLRAFGGARFDEVTARSVHTYMGPVGLVLLLLATVGVTVSLRTLRRLTGQLDTLRTGAEIDPPPVERRRTTLSFVWLVGTMWVLQLVLYVIQENVEAKASGLTAHGLGVLSGVHAWAPAVHFGVALLAAGFLWVLRRPIDRMARAVRAAAAMLAARRLQVVVHPAPAPRGDTPLDRWGAKRWSRPPPLPQAS